MLIMTKSNFKNSYDVISVTLPPIRHQNNVTIFFQFAPFPQIKICGYASGYKRMCNPMGRNEKGLRFDVKLIKQLFYE